MRQMAVGGFGTSVARGGQRAEPASPARDQSVTQGTLWWQLSIATGRQKGTRPAHDGEPGPLEGGEQHADRVAEQIMRMPADTSPGRTTHASPGRQISLPPTVQQMVDGPAQPLDSGTRAYMEERLGQDLQDVRIHTGHRAAEAARLLSASAFTIGSHVAFGAGQFAPTTGSGRRLLAHELAHVVQGRSSVGRRAPEVQRQETPKKEATPLDLSGLLPSSGLVIHLDRVLTLIDVLGEEQFEQFVLLIQAHAEAKKLTRARGVPAFVALYDTSREGTLDVAAARKALDSYPERYTSAALKKLRLRPIREAPPSFYFEDPASQQRESPAEGELPRTSAELRQQVFVESDPIKVSVGKNVVLVKYSYPEPDFGTAKVKKAKASISNAIGAAMADLTGLRPTTSVAERREELTVHAKLAEAWRGLRASSPLQVYIATDPRTEFETGQVAPVTDRVYVRLEDVGNPAKLQAAIRVPLIMLEGGMLPTAGDVPAASPQQLQSILLHEALHVMLIRQSSDANAIWRANRSRLTIVGNPYLISRTEELLRKYLIAQEEIFAYTNEASLYPPPSPMKASYEVFVKGVSRFLERRGIPQQTVSRSIPVRERVEKKAVTWEVTYEVPSGVVEVTVGDSSTIEFLLSTYALH
jgi:hypothetical protein